MKNIRFYVFAFLFSLALHATPPFPPRVFSDDRFCYVVGFPWPDQGEKVLIIRTIRKTISFRLQDLGIMRPLPSTAGIDWYREAIGFVDRFPPSGGSSKWGFYFRGADGHDIFISLPDGSILDPKTELEPQSLNAKIVQMAERLASSNDSYIRRAAAIHLGQLGCRSSIEILMRLINDESEYTLYRSNEELQRVYYVKEAAKIAISEIERRERENQK